MKFKKNKLPQSKLDEFKSQKRSKQIFLVGKKNKQSPTKNFVGKFFIFKSDDANFKCCSIRNKYEQQTIAEAETVVTSKKSKKKKIWNLIFFLINIAVIAVIFITQFNSEEGVSNINTLFSSETKWWYLLAAFGCYLGILMAESLKVYYLIYKTTKRRRHFLSFKVTAIGKYYDAVTPMASGGQPFQIYYLNKRGIRGDNATSIPLVKYMFWQITYVILCLIILVFKSDSVVGNNPIVISLAWITLAVNMALFIIVLMLSTSKKIGPKIVIWFLKILSKLHIVKNYQTTFRKVMRFVNDYQKTMRYYVSNIGIVIIQTILSFGETILKFTIPYFIYLALVPGGAVLWSEILVKMTLIDLATALMPLPGGTGAAEISFAALFGSLFGAKCFWAMLIWRFLTYFIDLILGIIVIFYDMIYGNKKAERLEKNGYWTAGFVVRKRFKKKRQI